MLSKTWFDYLPVWALFTGTVLLVVFAIEAGYRLARFRRRAAEKGKDAPVGSVIGGTLGLLAFLLAFTFGMAASRFDTRRELLLDEVNAIGTCYLRADLVPDPERVEIRKRLREYVHLRAELTQKAESLPELFARSDVLLDELWSQAVLVGKKGGDSVMHALFVDSLNDVIDFHTKRVVVGAYRIPGMIWLALYLVALLSMGAVGYQFGLAGSRDIAISLSLALAFSIVIGLIVDLDRISEGALRVSQQPMIDLDHKLETSQTIELQRLKELPEGPKR